MVRCKFKFTARTERAYGSATDLVFTPIVDAKIPEDQAFTRYTPNGELKIGCTNPAVLAQLKVGEDYYLDLTPVKPPVAAAPAPDLGGEA